MTRTEERLTDALAARAAAVAGDSIRPLPASGTRRSSGHHAGRRWSVSMAPLAAAASIATVTAVATMLPHHHHHHLSVPALAGLPPHGALLSVAAVAAKDVWAVGVVPAGRRVLPLIMRWNGKAWHRSPIGPASRNGILRSVDAVSAKDAWAAGSAGAALPATQPYILHWNGTGWRQTPTPKVPMPGDINGIAAVSAKDAWAVGDAHGVLILHWNGTRWQNTPNPWRNGSGRLNGVFAKSANDVWAVGRTGSGSLVLHWDGVAWHRLGGPDFARYGFDIVGVTRVSPALAWLVGKAEGGAPLILRWNGRTLRPVARYTGIVVPAGTKPIILRWNGRTWRVEAGRAQR